MKAVQEYLEARRSYRKAKEAADLADGLRKQKEQALVEWMYAQNPIVQSVDTADGMFYRRKFESISVTEGNNDQIVDWLMETEGDYKPFTTEKISKKELWNFLREKIKEGVLDPTELPEFLGYKSYETIAVKGEKTDE